MSWAFRCRTALVGGALGAAGGAGFAAALPAADLVAPVGTAATVGAVAAGLRRPNGSEVIHLLGLVTLVMLGTVVALGSAPTILSEAWGEGGWPAIRDASRPAPPTPQALAVPYLVTTLAAYLGTAVALRSRWGSVAWSPSLVAMLAGFLLGDEWSATSLWVPAAWAALVLVSARAGTDADTRRQSLAPSAMTGAAFAALVVAIVAAAGPVGERLPLASTRYTLPRATLPAPAESEHPLVTIVELRNGPPEVLFTADTTAPVLRWRLTVLDDYDGRRWASTQQFRPSASELPSDPTGGRSDGEEIGQQIELHLAEGADEMAWGRWLPAADGVLETSRDGLLFDTATRVLLAPDGDLPLRYSATSVGAASGDRRRSDAPAGKDEEARAASRLPVSGALLEELVELAGEITDDAGSDYARAVDIQRYLLGEGQLLVDEEAPGGHTVHHIHDFLLAGEGELAGTAEQYSTAFALLARAVGLPTRVVVGFEGIGTTGHQEVTAHAATAWVEIQFDELGWIAFDAVPDPTSDVLPPSPPAPTQRDDDDDEPPLDENEPGTRTDDDRPDDDSDSERTAPWVPAWAAPGPAALLLAVGLLGLVLVGAPGLRRTLRRRQRRRDPSPSGQIAGAWAAVVDDLRSAGLTVRRTMPVSELVRLASGRLPAQSSRITELGELANRSAFSRRPLGEPEADQAWGLSRAIVAARRSARSPHQRFSEYFSWR